MRIPTHVTIQTRYGPLTVHRGWLRGTIVNAQAWNRKRNRT